MSETHTPYDDQNIFAKILRGEASAIKVFEDEIALAFMDIMPRGEGHALVIPKSPARNIFDVDPTILGQLMRRVQWTAQAARKGMQADGLSIQQFNEFAGGQVVFHLHFHVIPRWRGVALKPPGIMGDPETIALNAAKIREAFKS